MKGLIIGLGSAGKQYLKAAVSMGHELQVVERDRHILETYSSLQSSVKLFPNLRSIENDVDYVIVATTAETHLEVALEVLKKKTPKYVVIEKIISNSLAELDKFRQLIKDRDEIIFVTHSRWQLLGTKKLVENSVENHTLGRFISFDSIGGGMCLITGSTHWLTTFPELFKINDNNFEISGNVSFSPQENRPNLDYVNGFINIRFFEANIRFAYSHHSFITPTQFFLFEHGAIVLHFDGQYQVLKGNPEEFSALKFRYKKSKVVEVGNSIGDSADPFRTLLEELTVGQIDRSAFQRAILTNELLIYALHLNGNRVITFQEATRMRQNQKIYTTKWRVS